MMQGKGNGKGKEGKGVMRFKRVFTICGRIGHSSSDCTASRANGQTCGCVVGLQIAAEATFRMASKHIAP